MREMFRFSLETLPIDWDSIFIKSGAPSKKSSAELFNDLFSKAKELFLRSWRPAGVISDVTVEDFSQIFLGDGKNDVPNPLDSIFRKADSLALYVVTSGKEIGRCIADLNRSSDLTLAYLLDVIASEATEVVADTLQKSHATKLGTNRLTDRRSMVLRYSPGYCGWHIGAQKSIFAYLKPEDIGVFLNEGLVMNPLKSTSGVIISGPREIHNFENNFTFCRECKTHNCRKRLDARCTDHGEDHVR